MSWHNNSEHDFAGGTGRPWPTPVYRETALCESGEGAMEPSPLSWGAAKGAAVALRPVRGSARLGRPMRLLSPSMRAAFFAAATRSGSQTGRAGGVVT